MFSVNRNHTLRRWNYMYLIRYIYYCCYYCRGLMPRNRFCRLGRFPFSEMNRRSDNDNDTTIIILLFDTVVDNARAPGGTASTGRKRPGAMYYAAILKTACVRCFEQGAACRWDDPTSIKRVRPNRRRRRRRSRTLALSDGQRRHRRRRGCCTDDGRISLL